MAQLHEIYKMMMILPFISDLSRTVELKVKVKFTLEEAAKAQRGSRGVAVLFL